MLDAELRSKFGITEPAIYRVATFGELCSTLGISSSPNVAPQVTAASPAPWAGLQSTGSGINVGVDLESVAAMPAATDYWEHDFYKKTFTAHEIAYALLQTSPLASFAAMWCAKEALRKADASLAQLDWQRLEVVHDSQGKPGVLVDGQQVNGALSLSHTDEIAFAVFVAAQPSEHVAPPAKVAQPPVATAKVKSSRVQAVATALALLLSLAAIVISLLGR
jgi:phosphopantetheine--protein transferase-like protein